MMAKVVGSPLCITDTGKVWNQQMAKSRIVLSLLLPILLILVKKTSFHNNLVLIVDEREYLTWMNCAYPLARYMYGTYKIDGMTYAYSRIFWRIPTCTWHWSLCCLLMHYVLCVVMLFADALRTCILRWCPSANNIHWKLYKKIANK